MTFNRAYYCFSLTVAVTGSLAIMTAAVLWQIAQRMG